MGDLRKMSRTLVLCWTASGTRGLMSRESSCFVGAMLAYVIGVNLFWSRSRGHGQGVLLYLSRTAPELVVWRVSRVRNGRLSR